MIFLIFFRKQFLGFDRLCKSSPKESICMKCQSLFFFFFFFFFCFFFGKNKKNIFNLLSAEFAQRAVRLKKLAL